jgi:hypothetical protein
MQPDLQAEPMERRDYEAATLMRQHPPVLRNENKQQLFWIACPPDAIHSGRLSYSRWAEMPLPASVEPARAAELVVVRDGFYDYCPMLEGGAGVEWHVNFADPRLFVAYGLASMAQDELQAAEHPVLGALREALIAEGLPAVTVERGRPTPVLVTGVERRVHLATAPNAAEGRPDGLYGGPFRGAYPLAIRRATTVLDPPTITNLIAIAAPVGGYGRYALDQIEFTIATAFSGFRAARLESDRVTGHVAQVVVHTGFWGCGAFGGNHVLMSLLQILAAQLAGVDRLVFYAGEPARRAPIEKALTIASSQLGASAMPSEEVLVRVAALGLEWGASDGN